MYLLSCAKELRSCEQECNGFVRKVKPAAWRRLDTDWENATLFPWAESFQ